MDQMALSQRVRKLKIEFKSPDRNVHYFESHNTLYFSTDCINKKDTYQQMLHCILDRQTLLSS